MPAGIEFLHAFSACSGRGVVVGPGQSISEVGDLPLAFATALAEREASGEPIRVVVLRLAARDDAAWAAAALDWLARHGRRVLVRTPVVLGDELVQVARQWGSTILLELAHPRAVLQSALLGRAADSIAALLLHAQHLRRAGLEVAAVLGPLLPVIHERDADVVRCLRHAAAADLRHVHLSVGRLSSGRLAALESALSRAELTSLLRAFGLDATKAVPLAAGEPARRLAPIAAASLYHSIRRFASSEGLRVDACGCPAQCQLDPELTPAYVDLQTSDLFADAG